MLQNIRKSRGGFTLVEIMIVVAIIALLAAIAVPGFLRARKRSQATSILNDARVIDGAMDQYAIENNKPGSASMTSGQFKSFFKPNSRLYTQAAAGTALTDILGQHLHCRQLRHRCEGEHRHHGELHGRDRQRQLLLGRVHAVSIPLTFRRHFVGLQRPFGPSEGAFLFPVASFSLLCSQG